MLSTPRVFGRVRASALSETLEFSSQGQHAVQGAVRCIQTAATARNRVQTSVQDHLYLTCSGCPHQGFSLRTLLQRSYTVFLASYINFLTNACYITSPLPPPGFSPASPRFVVRVSSQVGVRGPLSSVCIMFLSPRLIPPALSRAACAATTYSSQDSVPSLSDSFFCSICIRCHPTVFLSLGDTVPPAAAFT